MTETSRIVFVAYEGASLLDLAGPLEAFRIATAFGGAPYDCVVASCGGGAIMTSGGVPLVTQTLDSAQRRPIDTLILPGAFQIEQVLADHGLVDWLRRHAERCRRVCSVCVGSFILAEAGLLNGKRAATHWLFRGQLEVAYPQVRVDADAIFVRDGQIWTSAGVTSGIDLALALIEEDAGRRAAIDVARMLVVYLKRAGGQSQYSALLAAQAKSSGSDAFSALEQWVAEHPAAPHSVATLAERTNMSPRNFARVYAAARGVTPAKAVEAIRLDAARRMLEETTERIESIAVACGFRNEERLRAAFARNLGLPPIEYRKRFTRESGRACPLMARVNEL